MSFDGLAVTTADAAAAIHSGHGYTVDPISGCWLHEAQGPGGLGPFRAFYTAAYGEVPPTFKIVFVCSGAERGCVRPTHMDVLTPGQLARPKRRRMPSDVAATFAERLTVERAARGQSRRLFAREVGVSEATIGEWERGVTSPDADQASDLAHALGWDGEPRRFEVTMIVQRVVVARGAGEAAQAVRVELESETQPERSQLVAVKRV